MFDLFVHHLQMYYMLKPTQGLPAWYSQWADLMDDNRWFIGIFALFKQFMRRLIAKIHQEEVHGTRARKYGIQCG